MSDDNSGPEVDASIADEISSISLGADAPETFDSARSAAEALVAARAARLPADGAKEPPAEPELSDEDDSDPETEPAEQKEETEPEAPAIEPPNSWTKAEKERFATLPRETQEYLHTRELERERAFSRSQNELAEQRKAIEGERGKAEQLRQQYEANLPALMQTLQDAQQSSFADIRTVDDVTKLASEDPFRYLQWQAHQTKLQAVNAEVERSKGEKTRAEQSAWNDYVQKQNELAVEYIPELADKTKAEALTSKVGERMKELGFKQDELNGFIKGEKISPFDYRFQRLLVNDLKLSDILTAKTAVAAKPLPTVQRPGVAKPSSGVAEEIKSLTDELNRTGDIKIAQKLRALQVSRRAPERTT